MEDQIVTIETALLAEEKGLNIPCRNAYSKSSKELDKALDFTGEEFFTEHDIEASNDNEDPSCLAPTQTTLQKWLREIHNIDVVPDFSKNTRPKKYVFSIYKNEEYQYIGSPFYNIYEECLEEGLKQALKLIP